MGILISVFSSFYKVITWRCYWDSTQYLEFSIRRSQSTVRSAELDICDISPHGGPGSLICNVWEYRGYIDFYLLSKFLYLSDIRKFDCSPSRKKSEYKYWNMKLLRWGERRGEEWGRMMAPSVMMILVVVVVPSLASQEEWSLSGLYRNPNTSIFLTGDNICTKRETWVLTEVYITSLTLHRVKSGQGNTLVWRLVWTSAIY